MSQNISFQIFQSSKLLFNIIYDNKKVNIFKYNRNDHIIWIVINLTFFFRKVSSFAFMFVQDSDLIIIIYL